MTEVGSIGCPRIALVYGGDRAAVDHLRAGLAGAVDIACDRAAAEFDPAGLAGQDVAAVLVALDGGDWLEPLTGRIEDAGFRMVFDDPAISRPLEGWARARWRRHLVAKLAGNRDYDPPRPAEAHAVAAAAGGAVDAAPGPSAAGSGDTAGVAPAMDGVPQAAAAVEVLDKEGDMVDSFEGAPSAAPDATQPELAAPAAADAAAAPDDPLALDPDTAALSALIDSQLAASAPGTPVAAPEAWTIANAEPPKPATFEPPAAPDQRATPAHPRPVSNPVDDAEVLKGLPSLDDWQLVDPAGPDEPAAKAAAGDKAAVPAIDIAGLELVPMEDVVGARPAPDPIERWMDTAERVARDAKRKRQSGSEGGGA